MLITNSIPDQSSSDTPKLETISTLSVAAIASGALTACGGGDSDDAPRASNATQVTSVGASAYAYPSATSDAEAARFLLQAQFSASDAEIAALRATTYEAWLQTQFAKKPGQTGFDWLMSQGHDIPTSDKNYIQVAPADYMLWNQLMTAPDSARKRMALALSEIFVVSLEAISGHWPSFAAAHYWDLLCTHAFGNYRDLLEAVTLNLAMGNYLNTRGNKKADGKGSAPDENYAREVMQLFTIGLVELKMDGNPQLANGNTIETYSNDDVTQLAKVFTGYDKDTSQDTLTTSVTLKNGDIVNVPLPGYVRLPMIQAAGGKYHSFDEVKFLKAKIDAGKPAADALKIALDTLFNHDSHAPFICKQLIQRFVTSNPSPAYVERVAKIYVNNGRGVRGDLARVYAAILLDDEARDSSGPESNQFGKVREPMIRQVQWARTFGAKSASGTWAISDRSSPSSLGQSPLRAGSVFNFFRPGYVPPATRLSEGAVAPEFQLVNEVSVAGYINAMERAIKGLLITGGDISADYSVEIGLTQKPTASNPSALVNRLNLLLCADQLSTDTVATISDAVGKMPGVVASPETTATNLRNRACAAILLVMASAEYIVQK